MFYSVAHVSALVEAVESTGFAGGGRLAAAGLSLDAAGSVPAADFERLLASFLAESNNPALGLAMGERASLVALGLTNPRLGSVRPTLRMVIETFIARYVFSIDGLSPELSVEDDEATLSFPVHGASAATRRLRAEYGVALGLLLLRTWNGPFATPSWLSFPHEAPSYAHEYRRVFGSATRFGAERAALGFSAELLRTPAYLWRRQLVHSASTRATRAAASARLDETVRKLLISGPCRVSDRPEMAEIAARMCMHERTLRRQLASIGVCFRELLAEALRERALSLMLDGNHSPDSVSTELGFSQTSAFHRAFKRWTGFTPMHYRHVYMRDNGGRDERGIGDVQRRGTLTESCDSRM
jgi:AraC-like DNA-binding protein